MRCSCSAWAHSWQGSPASCSVQKVQKNPTLAQFFNGKNQAPLSSGAAPGCTHCECLAHHPELRRKQFQMQYLYINCDRKMGQLGINTLCNSIWRSHLPGTTPSSRVGKKTQRKAVVPSSVMPLAAKQQQCSALALLQKVGLVDPRSALSPF